MMDELQIVNLSSITLSSDEGELLRKGFSFTPVPRYNSFDWVKDVNLFARKLSLKKYYATLEIDTRHLAQRECEAISTLEQLQLESEHGVGHLKGPFSNLKPR